MGIDRIYIYTYIYLYASMKLYAYIKLYAYMKLYECMMICSINSLFTSKIVSYARDWASSSSFVEAASQFGALHGRVYKGDGLGLSVGKCGLNEIGMRTIRMLRM